MTRNRTQARTAGGLLSRRAALGLLFSGGTVVGLRQTGAYSSTVGERGFEASTAEDPDALLGITGNDDTNTAPELTNNSNYTMDVTLESGNVAFDVDGDGTFAEPVSFELDPEEAREFEVSGGSDTVSITAILSAGSEVVGSIELVRSFAVSAVAAIKKVEGSIKGGFGNGKYRFALTNTADEQITLNGFGVEWTNPDSDLVSANGGQPTLANSSDNADLITQPISVGGGVYDVIAGNEVLLEPGIGVDFEFRRFRDAGGGPGGGPGGGGVFVEDVDLLVRADDGSTAVIELRSDQ